jgi:hypothetical protein
MGRCDPNWILAKLCKNFFFTSCNKHVIIVDILVAARGIPSWITFLIEEVDSKKSKEDH